LPVTIATVSTGLSITESQILSGAGLVSQYIRGDGSLADFPATTGGGSSVSYYLNGSVSQGTIGGVAYKELNRAPVFGAGTDISISADGYIASFITDALDPNKLLIPAGNWNFETYFSASSSGGSPSFYVELYKYNGTTFTLIASSSTAPELIAFGTNLNPYFSTLAVPETVLALTDRLALRYYVTHSGRTITLHTENDHLCQVITTFTTGLTALNGLTNQVQFFAVGSAGTDFAISSASDTHTFNLPTASATNRGALSSADWTTFNNKTSNLGTVTSVGLSSATSGVTIGSSPVTTSGTITLAIATASGSLNGLLSSTDWTTFNGKQNLLTNPVTGTGTTNYLPKFTGSTTIGNSTLQEVSGNLGLGVTPSAWGSSWKALQMQNGVALWSYIGAGGSFPIMTLSTNATDVSGTTKYVVSSFSTDYVQESGTHYWRNAPSGTAGNAITFTQAMTLFSDGNLLLTNGTVTNAGFKLDVNGTGRFSGTMNIQRASVGATTSLQFKNEAGNNRAKIVFGGSVEELGFYAGDGSAVNLTIASTGAATFSSSVTAATESSFSGTSVNTRVLVTASGVANTVLGFNNSGSTTTGVTNNTAYLGVLQAYPLVFTTDSVERMRITSGGTILIGKTSSDATLPGCELSTTGAVFTRNADALLVNREGSDGTVITLRRSNTTVGTISVTTLLTSYNTTSDYRLKQDFKNYNGLELVSYIKTYDYEWKLDKSRMYGIVAHELQEILPYAVNGKKDGEEMQGVDYSKIVPILIKAIQELKEEIDTLKN
jgi:hypothetical protein